MNYKKTFKNLDANFVVISGTQENGYEIDAATFNTKEQAEEFANECEEDSDFDEYVAVCSNEKEFEDAVKEISNMRIEFIQECGESKTYAEKLVKEELKNYFE